LLTTLVADGSNTAPLIKHANKRLSPTSPVNAIPMSSFPIRQYCTKPNPTNQPSRAGAKTGNPNEGRAIWQWGEHGLINFSFTCQPYFLGSDFFSPTFIYFWSFIRPFTAGGVRPVLKNFLFVPTYDNYQKLSIFLEKNG